MFHLLYLLTTKVIADDDPFLIFAPNTFKLSGPFLGDKFTRGIITLGFLVP
jgi:hypothetical protein